MNILTVACVLLILAVAILTPLLMAGAYRKFRGKRTVICPETDQAAAVEVDAPFAAVTAIFGAPSLRLKTCSRWPENKDCGQECLEQLRATPEVLLEKWSAGKVCTLCGKPIGAMHVPALMDASGRTFEWKTFPPEKAPEVLATHRPVCWSCHRQRTDLTPLSGVGSDQLRRRS